MQARELMTTPAQTCGPHDSASIAAQLMWDHDCGAVPVVDDRCHLTGIVTDRDLCMAAHIRGLPLSAIPIETVMTGSVCTCAPDSEISDVEHLMGERQIRRIPVVNAEGSPVGMLSLADIAIDLRRSGAAPKKPGQDLLVAVAEICEHRVGHSPSGYSDNHGLAIGTS